MYMTKITLPALLLSAVLAAPAQNLLQNGDFEDDVAHWRSSGVPHQSRRKSMRLPKPSCFPAGE